MAAVAEVGARAGDSYAEITVTDATGADCPLETQEAVTVCIKCERPVSECVCPPGARVERMRELFGSPLEKADAK